MFIALPIAGFYLGKQYQLQNAPSDKLSSTLIPSKEDDHNTKDCYTYTIYPFPDRPSQKDKSEVGLYLHSTNKEPTCKEDVINFTTVRSENNFTVTLTDTTSSGHCIITSVDAGPILPNARVLLGKLEAGTYTVDIISCPSTKDTYLLEVSEDELVVIPVDVTQGKLNPNNNGVYPF